METKQSLVKLYNGDLSSDIISKVADSMVVVISSPVRKTDSSSQDVIFVDKNNKPLGNKGAGFFVSCDGYIITAEHVVEGASYAGIIMKNNPNNLIEAEIVAVNPQFDIAILKIDVIASPVKIGNYTSLRVGRKISFIGYPLNDTIQLQVVPISNQGVISSIYALPRKSEGNVAPTFMIDASVNPGNSGGPVFFADTGEVVGVVSQKFSNHEGIGIITALDPKLFMAENKTFYDFITNKKCN